MQLALHTLVLDTATFNAACQFLIPLFKPQQPLATATHWLQTNPEQVVENFAGFVDSSDNVEGSSRVAVLMIQASKHCPVLVEYWDQALQRRQRSDDERRESCRALQNGHVGGLASCLEAIKEVQFRA